MKKNKRPLYRLLIFFSVLFLSGCTSYPQLITSQYVDKPVVVGPCWKIGSKLDNYADLKNSKEYRGFETEVERVLSTSATQYGTSTYRSAVHSDNISRDILMQNPGENEIILIKRCYIGAYLTQGSNVTFGGVEGIIIPKPEKRK